MATDATGTPTSPDSIPTYNTSTDAPSGLGFNAAIAAIQAALTQIRTGTGLLALKLPGTELGYTEFSTNVAISATTDATANTVVTAPAVTCDGSSVVVVDFFAPLVGIPAAIGANLVVNLYQDGVDIGRLGIFANPAANTWNTAGRLQRRLTPASGSRTYSIRAWVSTGTGGIQGGAGGVATTLPGFIRVTKA